MFSKELLKGTLQPIILKLLSEEGELYGYQMAKRVKALSGERILLKEGSLYPILHKLHKLGYVRVRKEKNGKRIRKYYALTELGKLQVEEKVEELEAFIATLSQLLSNPKQSLS